MAALRFLAALFLLIATLALVTDVTPWLQGSGPFTAAACLDHWDMISPASREAAERAFAESSTPWLWTWILSPVLSLPTFVLFGVLGVLSGYAGRHRHRINIYQN